MHKTVLVATLSVLAGGCTSEERTHLSDAELIENFTKNRAAFERLRGMIQEDRHVDHLGIMDEAAATRQAGLDRSGDLTSDRLAEYRTRLRELGLSRLFRTVEPETIIFVSSSWGIVNRGSEKGYMWTLHAPTPLTDTLDGKTKLGDFVGYRSIEGNWYLYFDDS